MQLKKKKRLIIALAVIDIIFIASIFGINLLMDSYLGKMNRGESFSKTEVMANDLENNNVENILLIGIDKSDGEGLHRSDVMKIISLDYSNKRMKITSVQRDNLVYIPAAEKYDKLNHSYLYEEEKSVIEAFNYNFDMNITKYVSFDFDSVEHIVDILGGVDVDLTSAEAYQVGFSTGGVHTLNGKQALTYSRIRNLDSDYGRMERQTKVINAIIQKFKDESVFSLLDVIGNVLPYVKTNISNSEIKAYLNRVIGFDLSNIEQYQFPSQGYGSILTSLYLYGYGPQYVLKDFSGEVALMHQNIYGKVYEVSDRVKETEQAMLEMAGY